MRYVLPTTLILVLLAGCGPNGGNGENPARSEDNTPPAVLTQAWTCSGVLPFSKGKLLVRHESRPTPSGGVITTCSVSLPEGDATGTMSYSPGDAFLESAKCTLAADANKPSAPGTMTLALDTSQAQSSVFYSYDGKTVSEGFLACQHQTVAASN